MSKSKSCLMMLWLLMAGIMIGYIVVPVLLPNLAGTPAFWLVTMMGTGIMLLILLVLIAFVERGARSK